MHKNIIRMKRLTASEITPAGCSTSLYCTPGLQQTTAANAPLITDQSHLPKRGVQIKSANESLSGKTNMSVWRREDNMWNTRRQLCAADDFTGVFLGVSTHLLFIYADATLQGWLLTSNGYKPAWPLYKSLGKKNKTKPKTSRPREATD